MPEPDEPPPSTDRELLEDHRTGADGRAFAELARRHLGMVYSAALRVSGDAGAAEEISWAVLHRLAAERGPLPAHVPVNAWLHRAARSAALNHRRAEGRRRKREHTYATHRAMSDSAHSHDADPAPWEEIAPVLDEVLERLPAGERSVILSRFFAGRGHAEIAAELRLSADAARMRIHRALERMRGLLARRGIHTTASALAAALPAHGSAPVPAALAASVSAAFSLTAPPAAAALGASTSSTHSVLPVIMAKKTTLTAAAALLLLTGAGTLLFFRDGPAEGAPEASARDGGPRVATAAESPPGALPASPAAAAGKGEETAETPPPPTPWPDPEKLSRALREDIASSTVHTTLRAGETLVTGGYRAADGRHEITFLTPRAVTLEDGAPAVEVRAEVVSLSDEDVKRGGLESLATNARNTMQHAEAWGAPEVEAVLARLREKAAAAPEGQGGEPAEGGGSGIIAAPRITARPSQTFSIEIGAARGEGEPEAVEYTLEAVVEPGADGAFDVKSRIERSLSPAEQQEGK